jgi:molybdopterin synthase sulfur carrier subunit
MEGLGKGSPAPLAVEQGPVIRVKIHSILGLKEILGQRVVELSIPQGSTLRTLLGVMVNRWGARLSPYVADAEDGRQHPRIRILVNGQDIGFLHGLETELQDGDDILMLPLVSGG